MDTQTLANQILDKVGGPSNVREVFHCVTRLRFYLHDRSLADEEGLAKIPGVLGVAGKTEQLQVIIGNEVDAVCNAVQASVGSAPSDAKEKLAQDVQRNKEEMKKFRIGGLFETVAAIILPVIPALGGLGILKGIITIMTSYLGFTADMDLIKVMTIAADSVFYFLPFLIAWSASNRFKTDTALSLVLAGCLLYPTMTAGLAEGAAPMSLFGLPIPFVKYAASSIPIMLSVWVLKYIYAFVDKHMIKQLRLVFTPLVTMIFMVPITLVITGPIANYISQGIAWVFTSLFAFSPIIAGAVIGATRSLLVFTGMHLSLGAVCLNNITNYGYDIILPVNTMGTMAIVGVCLGVWICAKKQQNKEIGMSTLISSFIGITEPGIYGVLMVFRNALIADIIAGGVAGAWTAFWGCTSNAYVNSCILSLPVFMDEHFMFFCIGMVIAVVLGCGLTIFFGIDEGEGYPARMSFGKKTGHIPGNPICADTAYYCCDSAAGQSGEYCFRGSCMKSAFASAAHNVFMAVNKAGNCGKISTVDGFHMDSAVKLCLEIFSYSSNFVSKNQNILFPQETGFVNFCIFNQNNHSNSSLSAKNKCVKKEFRILSEFRKVYLANLHSF